MARIAASTIAPVARFAPSPRTIAAEKEEKKLRRAMRIAVGSNQGTNRSAED